MKNKAGKIITAVLLSGALALGTAPEINAETLNSENCYIYAAFDGVTVRKGPGTEYDKIGTIKGTGKLTYIDEQLDENYIPWYKIKFKNGKTGWITSNYSRRYIKKSALPEIEETEEFISEPVTSRPMPLSTRPRGRMETPPMPTRCTWLPGLMYWPINSFLMSIYRNILRCSNS